MLKTTVVITGLAAMMGCSSTLVQPSSYITQPEVCIDKNWYGYHQGSGCPSMATTKAVAPDASQEMAARLAALERERQRLADELDAARRQNGSLSSRVAE